MWESPQGETVERDGDSPAFSFSFSFSPFSGVSQCYMSIFPHRCQDTNVTFLTEQLLKGDATRDDSKRRFLAQQSFATLLRHCFEQFQLCSNIVTLCENKKISLPRACDKETMWVPDKIRTYNVPKPERALYPLELRKLTENSWRARRSIRFIFDTPPAYC